jgi:hypothetical protein
MTQYGLHELGAVEFPMLKAFDVINTSTSNTAQSAPTCVAAYTLESWAQIEEALRNLTALEFVTLANPDGGLLIEILEAPFKGRMETWV